MAIKKTHWLILIGITVVGLFIRTVNLENLPPALNWDEVSHAYNAYSLFKTGKDQWGQAFPILNYRAFGDYPAVLDTYLTVPFVAGLGPTDFTVRLPHALSGTLVILLAFVAAYRAFRRPQIALLVAFLVAFDAWTFFPSRAIFQSNFAVLFLTLGLALYLSKKFSLAILFWFISLLTYHNTRIFIPLFLASLLPVLFSTQRKAFILSLVTIFISLIILFLPEVRARGSWVSIIDSGAVAKIESLRNHSTLPHQLTKFLYNRPVYFVSVVIQNYISYFSPQFLFFSGGTQYQYSQPGFGLLNWAELPFFYLGLFYFLRRFDRLFLSWLVFSPLPAAITRDQNAVIRATTMLPVVYFCSAIGFWLIYSRLRTWGKQSILLPVIGVYLGFSLVYFNNYIYVYPVQYSSSWQYGYHQLYSYILSHSGQYDQIIITKKYGEPHEFLLWYSRWNPLTLKAQSDITWDYHDSWYWVDKLGKYSFVNDWEIALRINALPATGKNLVVLSPDSNTPIGTILETINYPSQKPIFIIKEI